MDNKKSEKTREDKLKELKIPPEKWNCFTDTAVDESYSAIMKFLSFDDNIQFMYFINSILISIDQQPIDSVSEFELTRDIVLTFDPEPWIDKYGSELKKSGIDISVHFN